MTTYVGPKSHEIEILVKNFICTVHLGYQLLELLELLESMKWRISAITNA